MSEPAELVPVLCPDGGEAASLWRSSKLKDFDWKLRVLGLEHDPVFSDLLKRIGEHTDALENLWAAQKQPGFERPWWADGEYDETRADSANDEGVHHLAAGRLGAAFDCFTEAIRLHPSSPVYHCNRAAVCLKWVARSLESSKLITELHLMAISPRSCPVPDAHLPLRQSSAPPLLLGATVVSLPHLFWAQGAMRNAGSILPSVHRLLQAVAPDVCRCGPHCSPAPRQCCRLSRADLAATDASNAIRRDPHYVKAYQRGGRAHLQLGQPQQALQLLRRGLELDPSHAGVKRSVAAAEAMCAQHANQREQEEGAARRGSRPGMTRAAVREAEAAEQLYSATQMLSANPTLQAARCAHVEGLILCQRYCEAEAACGGLLEGVDRLYLQAEVAWRRGDLEVATARLDSALALAPHSPKCRELRAFAGGLLGKWQEAQLAREDGALSDCERSCASLLEAVQPGACMGLYCAVRHLRAEACAAGGRWEAALEELNMALEGDGDHAECLQLRAEVHQHRGAHLEGMLDLQRLQKVAPGTPGLFARLEEAARLCLGVGGYGVKGCSTNAGPGGGVQRGGNCMGALEVLGLASGATQAQVRRAYLQLAGKWHPDKWVGAGQEARETAEVKFKQVQGAYRQLAG